MGDNILFGEHAPLQDEASLNAKVLLAVWMEDGITAENDFEIEKLPTKQLKFTAAGIKKTLEAGIIGFPWIAAANEKYVQQLADIAFELSGVKAEGRKPWLPYIFAVLNNFNEIKEKQYEEWGKTT